MNPHSVPRRSRRSSAEVHASLIDAARRAFSERGYSGATTREIAEAAGTSEAVLFRRFGSKASLFGASVMQPFASFVDRFTDKWGAVTEGHPARVPTQELFGELYETLRDQRDVILALMSIHRHELDMHVGADFSSMLEQVERLARREFAISGWDPATIEVDVRVGVGMLLATALFKEWLFSNVPGITDQQILTGMVDVLIAGVSRTPLSKVPARCEIEHDQLRQRVEFSGAPPAELFRCAADWLHRIDIAVDEVVWHADHLKIYYSTKLDVP